jgi:AcrR family transcriptional regulator
VVERSGQSLRSFYQYFAGKQELLLALFEVAVRSTADHLRELIAKDDDPLARLHRFTVGHYLMCRPVPKAQSGREIAATNAVWAAAWLTAASRASTILREVQADNRAPTRGSSRLKHLSKGGTMSFVLSWRRVVLVCISAAGSGHATLPRAIGDGA